MGGQLDLPEGPPLVAGTELAEPPAAVPDVRRPVLDKPPRLRHLEQGRVACERAYLHYFDYHRPLKATLTEILNDRPRRLEIAPDRSIVVVGLEGTFTGEDRKCQAIVRAVTAKLGDTTLQPQWHLHGRDPHVTFTRPWPPPRYVCLADIMPGIEAATWDQIIWGIGQHDARVITSVDTDAPHTGLSMSTGKGKSAAARNALAQMLYHGALGVILDYKRFSHRWALDLPNVLYAKTPAQIHALLLWLECETQRRNEFADEHADRDGNITGYLGPPIYVVCEELNATHRKITKYYQRELRQPGMPARSPASDAIDEGLFISRQVQLYWLLIGQRLSVKAVSGAGAGGDARDNIGAYVMCDPSQAAWNITGWDHPMPAACAHPGRIQVVTPDAVRETQGAYLTPAEARALAQAGTMKTWRDEAERVPDVPQINTGSMGSGNTGNVPDNPGQVPPSGPARITLPEAVEAGWFGDRNYEAVRKQLRRDNNAPSPAGKRGNAHIYDEEILRDYALSNGK